MKLPTYNFSLIKKNSDSDFLALDISPSSIKAIFFSEEDNSKFIAKGVSIYETERYGLTKKQIKMAVTECFNQTGLTAKNTIVGLSGDQVFGFLLIAKKKRKKADLEISQKEMQNVYQTVKKVAYRQVKDKWGVLFANDIDFAPLDLVVTTIMIDKKVVDNPVGLIGETISVSVFCSYSELSYYSWLVKALKSLNLNVLGVTTSLYAQSKILSKESKNYIVIDIGRFHTDIAIILGENIVQTRTFDLGGDYFSRALADELKVAREVADGKKEAVLSKTLPEDEAEKVNEILYSAGKDWRIALATVLTSMKGIKSYPEYIYLTGGGANLPILQELLHEEAWRQPLLFAGNIEIRTVADSLWSGNILDEVRLLKGPRMFGALSIGLVKLEIG